MDEIRQIEAALLQAETPTDGHDKANRRFLRLWESAPKTVTLLLLAPHLCVHVRVRVMTYVRRFGKRYCLCRQGLHKNRKNRININPLNPELNPIC
jgi:hypothetical protein